MLAGSLEIQLRADMARLAADLRKAQQMTGESMGAMGTSMDRVQKGIEAISAAEKERASIFARTMSETRRLFGISAQAAAENSKAVKQLQQDYEENLKVPMTAFASLALYRERAAYAIGAGVAMGIDKAKEWWEQFSEWVKEKAKTTAVIWGAAIVIGITAVVLTGIYAAYKSISFGIGLLTGESYKSANIDALAAMNKEVKTLQENLPLTAVGASALNEALKQQGTSATGYAETLAKAEAAARTNGEELDRLGVKYKDQDGALLSTEERLKSAAAVLATYKEGWDRNQAAQAIGMGSEKEIQDALAVTAEKIDTSKARLVAYGLVIGDGTQEAVGKYETAMRAFERESDLTSQGFKRAIADNIMPILTDLAEFFRDGFPTVVMAFRYSMATIMSLFYGLKTVVFMVAESIVGSLSAVGSVLTGLASAAWKALQGDFSGAKDAFLKGWEDAKSRLGGIGDNIIAQARNNSAAMAQAWGADSLGANSVTDTAVKTGKAWVAAEKAKKESTEDADAGYRRLLKSLKEKLMVDGELTEMAKLQLELDALSAKQRAAITPEREAELKALAQEIDLRKQALAVSKAWVEHLKQEEALENRRNETLANFNSTLTDARQGLEFETKLLQMQAPLSAAGLLTKEEEIKLTSEINTQVAIANALRQVDLQLRQQKLALAGDESEDAKKTIADLENLAAAQKAALPDAIRTREAMRLQGELTKNSVSEWSMLWSTAETTGKTVFSHIFSDGKNAIEGIGKAIKASIIDVLYQLTLKKWMINIGASVAGSFGVGAASAAGSAAGAAAGGGQMMSAIPSLASLGGTISTGFANASATTGAFVGNLFGGSQAAFTVGSWMPYIGAALAVYSIGKAILGGNGGTPSYALPDSTGSVARMAGRYSGLLSALGGSGSASFTYYANTGRDSQNPNFGVGAYAGSRQLFQVGEDYPGGLQRLTPENVALQETRAIVTALQSSDLPGYLKKFFDSLVPSQMDQSALDKALEFAASLKSIAGQLSDMGMQAAAASDGLITLLGSLGNAPDLLNQYFQNFRTEGERAAKTLELLDDQFVKLGASSVPATREEFRALVEAQDLSTDAGQRMFAGLMQLAPAFASVTTAIAETVSTAQSLQTAAGSASTAVDKLIQASQAAANAARQSADNYRSIAQSLADAVDRIRAGGGVGASGRFDALFGSAMRGDAASLSALPDAAADLLEASRASARTGTEFARERARVVGMLQQAGLAATGMANWQEHQATLLETQTSVLEQIKEELGKPSPDSAVLTRQAELLGTISTLLQEQTVQMVQGTDQQLLLMHDQTGKIILSNAIAIDQSGRVSSVADAINAGIRINSADVIAGYLNSVSAQIAGNNSIEANAVRNAIGILRATTADGLITAAEAAPTRAAIEQLRASTGTLLSQSLTAEQSAALDAASRAASLEQATKDQTIRVITGNATQDAIKNISAVSNSISEEMLRQLVTGSTTQGGTLQGVLDGTAQTIALLQQLVSLTAQQVAETAAAKAAREAAYAAELEASRKAAADKAAADKAAADAAAATATTSATPTQTTRTFEQYIASLGYSGGYDGIYTSDGERLGPGFSRELRDAYDQYIRGYAGGGIASGLSLVGERGTELADFTSPARIYTAEQTRGMFAPRSNDDVVGELRAMRQENAQLRSDIASIKRDTKRQFEMFQKMTNDGEAMPTEAA